MAQRWRRRIHGTEQFFRHGANPARCDLGLPSAVQQWRDGQRVHRRWRMGDARPGWRRLESCRCGQSYPTWLPVPNATWIGNAVTGDAGDWRYRVVIDASDPNIDLSSATLTFAYRTDNDMLSANLGATSLPVLPSATYNAVTPGTGGPISTPLTAGSNQLLVVTNNEGTTPSPYGLTMEATLTFNCRAGAPAAVPADAPWALMGLGGLLAASVAWAGRRRRKQS